MDIETKFHRFLKAARRSRSAAKTTSWKPVTGSAVEVQAPWLDTNGMDPPISFDRATDNRGKTGSWFLDLFGKTLRTPSACGRCRNSAAVSARMPPPRPHTPQTLFKNGKAGREPRRHWPPGENIPGTVVQEG